MKNNFEISKQPIFVVKYFLLAAMLLTVRPAFAEECPKGEYWVSPHFRTGYVRYDGVAVSATDVRGYCRANPRGYEKWHQRLSNERPEIWNYKQEKSKKWNTAEVERVYSALEILPQQLLDLGKVEIHRMIESKSKNNPATTNIDDVVLYDLAFKHKVSIEQILAHELSHPLYDKLSKEQKKEFAEASDWMNVYNHWIPKDNKVFLEEDSRKAVDEDFTNHIEHYLFKNESLKKKSPDVYKWIDKTFGKDFKLEEKK